MVVTFVELAHCKTSAEKASEKCIANSYKTMATNQDWLDREGDKILKNDS